MATRKKVLTVAERHEHEITQLRDQHARELDALHEQVRTHRKASFWQGAFIVGAPSIVFGVVFGALLTFISVVQVLPVAYEQVARTALFQQAASDNVAERAAEIVAEKQGAQ